MQRSEHDILTLAEVAEALGRDRRVVRNAIRGGELRAGRLGKRTYSIVWADVLEWVRKYQVAPSPKRSHDRHRVQQVAQRVQAKGGA